MKNLLTIFLRALLILSITTVSTVTALEPNNTIQSTGDIIFVDSKSTSNPALNIYATLEEAVAAATEGTAAQMGSTIKFINDYEHNTNSVNINKSYITIDLNGYTYVVKGTTVNAANIQGILVSKMGVLIKNGRMELDTYPTATGNVTYCLYSSENNKMLNVENIDFEYINIPDLTNKGNQPAGLLRSYQSANNVTNVRNCTFKYCPGERLGTAAQMALVSANFATMNFYNTTFDGGDYISGISVRGLNTQITNISLYNCEFYNLSTLFTRSSDLSSNKVVTPKFYGGSEKNVDTLAAEPNFDQITKGANSYFSAKKGGAEVTDLTTLSSPISFYANCEHNHVESTCTRCFAPVKDERAVELTMGRGASVRLGALNGLRFYVDVDKEKINELVESGYTVEAGTIIAPLDYVKSVNDLTLNFEEGKAVLVPYEINNIGTYYEEGFVASIVNIKESNTSYNQQYGNTARSFLLVL